MARQWRWMVVLVLAGSLAMPAAAQLRRPPPGRVLPGTGLPIVAPPRPVPLPPESSCAAFPETGQVGAPAPREEVAATPTPERGFHCEASFTLDLRGRLPLCVRPGLKAVDGNPRAACLAALPLGPLAPVAPRERPTRTCEKRRLETVVRLDGPNIGWREVTITAAPDRGVTITTLADSGAAVPLAENPVVQGCFPYRCRLVKLAVDATAAPEIELRAALPERDPVTVAVKLPLWCPRG